MEGSDPHTFEMVKKIQLLQKQVIAKGEQISQREWQIEEREKLYIDLKNISQRQPGPEVAEQMEQWATMLKDKRRQLKVLSMPQLP